MTRGGYGWRVETLADDPAIELEARQGGLTLTNIDPRLQHDIQVQLSRFITKANQLIGNVTTNLAECWMHIRSKFDGGKVINTSQSGSWEHPCMGAGLRQNYGVKWAPQVWQSMMTNTSPNQVFTDVAEFTAKKYTNDIKRKATDTSKEKRRQSKYIRIDNTAAARSAYTRHDDGISPEQVTEDISPEELESLIYSFFETKVVITEEEAKSIEEKTRNQGKSEEWKSERRKRLTASKVGGICKMMDKTKRSKKV